MEKKHLIVGDNPIKSIEIKEDGSIIEIDHEYDGLEEYQLSKISSIFLSEMRGWGPCSAGFYEAISLAEADLEYDFKRLSKTEFKEYVGNLKYAEYRCEEIYKRLEEIDERLLNTLTFEVLSAERRNPERHTIIPI